MDDAEARSRPEAEILTEWICCLHETLHLLSKERLRHRIHQIRDTQSRKGESDAIQMCEPTDCVDTNSSADHEDDGQSSGSCSTEGVCEEDKATVVSDPDQSDQPVETFFTEAAQTCEEIKSTINGTDPFNTEVGERDQMAELALLCFQNGIHGHPSRHLGQIATSSINASSDAQGCVPTNSSCGTAAMPKRDAEDAENQQQTNVNDDFELAVLLRCYFYLFVNHIEDVVETIERRSSSTSCTWDAVLECLSGW